MPAASSALAGFRIAFEGLALLRRERRLWRLAAVPFLLSLGAVVSALGIIVVFSSELYAFAAGWLPVFDAGTWLAWIWVGPAKLLVWLLGLALSVLLAGAILVGCVLVASLLASPFLDVLSRRVEDLVAGGVRELQEPGWLAPLREGGRAMLEEARRTAFFLIVQLGILTFGLLIPGGQLLAPPAMTLFTILFLPLDYSSYALDRRRLRFRDKRRWVLGHSPLMLGYGSAAFLTCLIPGLNLLAMPVLVAGGTLLVLRHPPSDQPPRLAPDGSRRGG